MKKSQLDAAIDAAVAERIRKIFKGVVDAEDLAAQKKWAKSEIDRAIGAFDVMHEALTGLAFDPEDEPAPEKESDDAYRARLLETVVDGTIHHQAVKNAIGNELDAIGKLYDLPRKV